MMCKGRIISIPLIFSLCLLHNTFIICDCSTSRTPSSLNAEKTYEKLSMEQCPCLPIVKSQSPNFVLETTDKIIENNGYQPEKHYLRTEDGYALQFYRIRDSSYPKTQKVINKPVVLLMHGVLGSSSDYVFAGEDNSLGFHLLKKGFDVWLGNFKGNIYGGLEFYPGKFWDFSFHEMGKYDLPAYIDYILDYTKQEKLFYLGYSMGTTAAYVMLSEKPLYNQKIERMISMAPVVYTDSSKSSFVKRIILWFMNKLDKLGRTLKTSNLSYLKRSLKFGRTPKCFRNKWKKRCVDFFSSVSAGEGHRLYNKDIREKFHKIAPVGGSMKTVAHFAQVSRSGIFRPFSYYESKNEFLYDVKQPDPYDLSKVEIPILLILGEKDRFSLDQNIQKLTDNLISVESLEVKYVDDFNHLDFFLANNLDTLVFKPVTDYLTKDKALLQKRNSRP